MSGGLGDQVLHIGAAAFRPASSSGIYSTGSVDGYLYRTGAAQSRITQSCGGGNF